jgi:hypothetical protein
MVFEYLINLPRSLACFVDGIDCILLEGTADLEGKGNHEYSNYIESQAWVYSCATLASHR